MKYITVHCSATPPSMDIGVEEIRKMHLAKGWSDVGYHEIIRRDGTRESGRPVWRTGAHVKGHNRYNIGISLVGGVDEHGKAETNFTEEQYSALREAINHYVGIYGIPLENIKGHRDWFPDINGDGIIDERDWLKDCPCFSVQDLLESWRV